MGPNGHSTSDRRWFNVDITSLRRRPISKNFHVISTCFFDVILLIKKSTSFPRTFFDVISMVEKSTLFPRTFFYVISFHKISTVFLLSFFGVLLMIEESTLSLALRWESFSEKNIEKKHLCRHEGLLLLLEIKYSCN